MAKDLTQGRIMPMLIKFTIPLILGNIFQLTYNAVDSIIVGRFVGKEAKLVEIIKGTKEKDELLKSIVYGE